MDVDYVVGKKYKKIFDIDIHAHMFRHSVVSLMLENGAQQKVVKAITGIRNDSVLNRYTHIKKKHIRETYDKTFDLD